MNTVEQVYPDLYIAKHEMRPNWFCSVLVFLGKNKIDLVDTGFIETINDIVFPFILEQGRSIDEIDTVVNTHRDGDHIKGNPAIKEQTEAIFAAHRLEAEVIPETNQLLDDGATVNLGDRSFKVIHTPGHRPGAICLYEEGKGLLITDDVVCGTREDLIRMEKETYIKSLKNLETLNIETMIMSHPFKPAGKNILNNAEAQEMIKASIKIAQNL